MAKTLEANAAPVNGQQMALTVPERAPTHMDLLSLALQKEAAIDVIERLAALQREEQARNAEIDFNDALNRVQDKIKRIAPDLENPQKHSRYASYAAIDRVIRPIYGPEGFSLSFTHADCPKPDHIRVICWVRLRGHKEPYQVDWPVDTKGPKGEPVMTATQATGASDSYAKRYLVKDIFNIAIGEDDTDGNGVALGRVEELCEWLANAKDLPELQRLWMIAKKEGVENNDRNALERFTAAKDARKKDLS